MSLGTNIKNRRKQLKMTQFDLAAKSNISRSYLSDVEKDRYNPSLEVLKSIANALHTKTSMLLGESEESGTLTPKEERDIAIDLERMLNELESNEALAFHGESMDEETRELMRISLENSMRLAKQIAKNKFTPNKYKNK